MPAARFSRVLLPQPLGPSSTRNSPRCTSSEMFCKTGNAASPLPNDRTRFSICKIGSVWPTSAPAKPAQTSDERIEGDAEERKQNQNGDHPGHVGHLDRVFDEEAEPRHRAPDLGRNRREQRERAGDAQSGKNPLPARRQKQFAKDLAIRCTHNLENRRKPPIDCFGAAQHVEKQKKERREAGQGDLGDDAQAKTRRKRRREGHERNAVTQKSDRVYCSAEPAVIS